jgi:hypothetical protein
MKPSDQPQQWPLIAEQTERDREVPQCPMKYVLPRHIPTSNHSGATAIRGNVITLPEHDYNVFRRHRRRPVDCNQRVEHRQPLGRPARLGERPTALASELLKARPPRSSLVVTNHSASGIIALGHSCARHATSWVESAPMLVPPMAMRPRLVLRHHETRTAASRATACISSMPATG